MKKIIHDIFVIKEHHLQNDEWQEKYQVLSGFSTRAANIHKTDNLDLNMSYTVGDDSDAVLHNRQLLACDLGIDLSKWIFAAQKHTNNICEVTAQDCGAGVYDFESGISNVDGLYTKEKGIVLATFHADCTPLYFHAPKHGLIGVAHAGWQGTVKEIAAVFVEKWYNLGISPQDIYVVIGPSPTWASYYVGEDVIMQIQAMKCQKATAALVQMSNTKYKLDTAYLNQLVLEDIGIPIQNIKRTLYCTISDDDILYSFRKEGETGRMLAFITQ